MFVIPCKYTPQSPILECVETLSRFHPDEKILIVDSNSDDTSYMDAVSHLPNVLISKFKNSHYEIGALWCCYDEYPDENVYVLIHDGVILKKDLSKFLYDEKSYNFLYFYETIMGAEYEYLKSVLASTEYSERQGLLGTVGSMCIVKKNVMKNFVSKNLINALKPNNKWESNASERIVGLCLEQEGVNMAVDTLDGDVLTKVDLVVSNGLEYFNKKYIGRQ